MADEKKKLYTLIMERQGHLAALRLPHEDLWGEVIDVFRPELTPWDSTNDGTGGYAGEKTGLKNYSGAPEEALSNWADGMQGHLVSSSLDWFNYHIGQREFDEIPEVRYWRQQCRQITYSLLRDSNFYPAIGPAFLDAGSIGDATIWIDGEDGLDFKTFHPRELYHHTDVFHRKFMMTAKEAVATFGKDDLSVSILHDADNTPFNEHEFLHVCYLRTDTILKDEDVPPHDYTSIYIATAADVDKQVPLKIEGYHTKPYARWRYSSASDSRYGWGIGCSAMVDSLQLNETARTNMQAQQMAVNPAVMAHASLRTRMNLNPGGITFFNRPEEQVKPIMDRLNVPFGLDREDRLTAAIDRRFNVDFFLMLARAQKPMTATEIIEKSGEKSILLSPKIGRMERYLLDPTHERVFALGQEKGWYPKAPEILLNESNGRIDVDYIGPLAQAQKRLFSIRKNEQTLATIGPMVQLDMTVLDNVDLNKAVVRMLREDDWPEEEIRSPEEVAAIRQERAKAQQAQMEQEQAMELAKAAPGLSKKVEDGSMIKNMAEGLA